MMTKNKSLNCCVTCANSGEPRREHFNGAKVEHSDTRGKCYAEVFCSVTQGPTAMSETSCSKYQLGSAFK